MPLSPRPAKATAFTLGAACVVLWFTLTHALWGTDWLWHSGWDGVALVAALPSGAALILGIRLLARAQPAGRHGSWAFAGVVVVLLAAGAVFFGAVISQEWGHCGPTPESAQWHDPSPYQQLAMPPEPPAAGLPTGDVLPPSWALASVTWWGRDSAHETWFQVTAPGVVRGHWLEGADGQHLAAQLADLLGLLGRPNAKGDAEAVLATATPAGHASLHDEQERTVIGASLLLDGLWNATGIVPGADQWSTSGLPGRIHAAAAGLDLRAETPVKRVDADDGVTLMADEQGQVEVRAVWGEMDTAQWLERVQSALEPYDVQVPGQPEMSISIC